MCWERRRRCSSVGWRWARGERLYDRRHQSPGRALLPPRAGSERKKKGGARPPGKTTSN
jgi:hypothetical protein